MEILVIDIETSGFDGDTSLVLEIGVVKLDLETGKKTLIFNHVVDDNTDYLGINALDKLKNAWIFKNSSLQIEEVFNAPLLNTVRKNLQELFNKYSVTAFNRKFDITFLEKKGFEFPKLYPCPMLKSTPIVNKRFPDGNLKWCSVQEAYDFFYPNNTYTETHRAWHDAWHEAEIVYALINYKK